jgi:hypothetical protein
VAPTKPEISFIFSFRDRDHAKHDRDRKCRVTCFFSATTASPAISARPDSCDPSPRLVCVRFEPNCFRFISTTDPRTALARRSVNSPTICVMRAAVMLENTNNMAFRAERFCSGCTNLDVHKTPISVRPRESGDPDQLLM